MQEWKMSIELTNRRCHISDLVTKIGIEFGLVQDDVVKLSCLCDNELARNTGRIGKT